MPRKSTKKTAEEQQQPQTYGNHFEPGNSLQPVGEHQQQQLALFPQNGINFEMNGMFQHHWNPHFSLPFSAYPNQTTATSPNPYFCTNMFGFGGFPMGGTRFGAFQPNLFQQNQQLMQYQMKYASTNHYLRYMMIYNAMMAQSISMQLAQTPFDPALVPEANSKRNHNEEENTDTPKKKSKKTSKNPEESAPIAEMQATEELLVDVVSLDNAYFVSKQPFSTSTQPVKEKTNKTAVPAPNGGISMSIEKLLGLKVNDEPVPKKKNKSKTAVNQPSGSSPSTSPPHVVVSSPGNDAKSVENRKKSETACPQNDTNALTSPPDVVESFLGNKMKAVENKNKSETKITEVIRQTGSKASTASPHVVQSCSENNTKTVEKRKKSETKLTAGSQQNDTIAVTSLPDVVENSTGNEANAAENTQESKISDVCPQTNIIVSTSPSDVVGRASENDVTTVENTQETKISNVNQQNDIIMATSPPEVVESSSRYDSTTEENTQESKMSVCQQISTNDSTTPPQMVESSSENNTRPVENTQETNTDAPQQNNVPPATVLIDITFTLEDERELRTLHGQYLKQPRCSTTRELLFEEWAQRIVEGEKDDMKMKKALALSRSIIRRRTQQPETDSNTNKQTNDELGGTKRKLEVDSNGSLVLKVARKEQAECEQKKEESQSDEPMDEGNQISSQEPQVQPAENDDAKN
ncbi:hypothetical protein B9Z55_026367 [Caenorhabditis nigoni]|uniref:Uncharacterized protein n=1 Tax=Caenorhabditis nigoni TaxID=1611254 RepID=A0A2G5T2Y4_9PELO|nr:hypothetical protein B9Z55_026367 [Caenorhabditis nigoni]